ncbi:hypothetical protein DYBT9623_03870 [Dyadobacter sp. CECT 9623]|uniref:Uncharacterized protein n=1 Tax=Dyadobacter linearis TaxID=2823330 RepID=A0ABN7RE87_9BACT|nr:hypothetical protein [Dyadobacter sp. CECT 9623]CAG5071894.1 hypothetical protein DYBT9623_03870 [Dyadobacter sp. CECT 9623]
MRKYLFITLSAAVFLIFLFTLFENALNAPSFDDYDTTINFIRRYYFDTESFKMRKDILLSRHNEHRILFSKSCAAIYYAIFGQLNFRHLIIFQNIFLLSFFGLMIAVIRQNKQLTPEMLLITCLFLFSLAFWQVTFYYWGGIQHYTVFFFSFLTLFAVNNAKQPLSASFFLGLLAALLAVLSFGNGFLALFLAAFILLIQRKWLMLGIWVICAAVLLYLTFLPLPEIKSAAGASFNAEWMARLLLTFLGSYLYINPATGQSVNIIVCMLMGLSVLIIWAWLFWKGYASKNPLLFSLLSLPILSGIIVAVSRFESKAAGGIAPRYMFFTATIPVLLVLILLDLKILKKEHLKYIAGIVLVIWGFGFYNNRTDLQKHNAEIVATIQKWESNPGTRLVYYREAYPYSEILSWAISKKVVIIPAKTN